MKRKIIAVSAVLAALLAGGYSVQAGPMGMGCRNQQLEAEKHGCRTQMNCREEGGCLEHFGRMADALELSESQRQEIEAVVTAEQENHGPLMEKIAEGKRQLMEASRSGEMDEAKIAGLAEEQGRLMGEMMVSRIRIKGQIFALLTPEQQEKAAAFCDGCDGVKPGCDKAGCGPRCGNMEQKPAPGGTTDKTSSL
ncbi:MAG: Spy/CpxP family protein refolding chaperone [Proteobacteria bacterium]|nr:hypothetical protein [Desulfobulbaceae bacterium]MBU4152052.1 Spy/CpxP family protein refolding chaperone [Pseudomonadota bacterium]MDP2107029.1 Spy/CpxP family protein refolding chaperone [Desulfobulbaceae bacterium]